MGLQFGETVYISEFNVAKEVKPNAQVTMNKISDPLHIFFVGVGVEDSAPNSNFSTLPELSETSRAKMLILGLHVNKKWTRPTVADMTLHGRYYIGGPAID